MDLDGGISKPSTVPTIVTTSDCNSHAEGRPDPQSRLKPLYIPLVKKVGLVGG